jgi:phosphoribosylformimino-5-aminoimidazole carboxamide ribotide isomerase
MKIIPAIDLMGGRCVRLHKGDFSRETVYSDDPVEVALHWQRVGAEWLHVVDLDGAKSGSPCHTELISHICRAVDIPVHVGGGLRSLASVQTTLEAGASRAVLGTAALEDAVLLEEALRRWGGSIAVALDAREGVLATRGWLDTARRLAVEAASEFAAMGVRCLIYTDVSRDGTLQGPDLQGLKAIKDAAGPGVQVIASGGVRGADDLLRLREYGAWGAIVGKALYDGLVDLPAFLDQHGGDRVAGS